MQGKPLPTGRPYDGTTSGSTIHASLTSFQFGGRRLPWSGRSHSGTQEGKEVGRRIYLYGRASRTFGRGSQSEHTACLMAIRRFACKRGAPEQIFSDNATCFRGASAAMIQAIKKINIECAEKVTSTVTAWHLNPPGSPHMGGVWERMVRSVKEALRALDDGRKLTDEILSTSLAEAEDMINTRPLTYVPQEAADEEVITPNHFIRGTVTGADMLLDDAVDLAASLTDVYKRSVYLANRMWELL